MTWKSKSERTQYHNMLLQSQIMNLLNSFKNLYEQVDYANITTSQLYDNFRPPKTPTFNQMKNIEFFENFFIEELEQLFITLKKTEVFAQI